jgi:hypothetical protein
MVINHDFVTPEDICPLPIFPKPNSKQRSSTSLLTFDIIDLNETPKPSSSNTNFRKKTISEIASTSMGPIQSFSQTVVSRNVTRKQLSVDLSQAASVTAQLRKPQKQRKRKAEDENQSDYPCIYCRETFVNSKKREKWIQCGLCQHWAHQLCAGYEAGSFTCDFCL